MIMRRRKMIQVKVQMKSFAERADMRPLYLKAWEKEQQ